MNSDASNPSENSFAARNKQGEVGEQAFKSTYPWLQKVTETHREDFSCPTTGIKVEVKTDYRAATTGNAFLEYTDKAGRRTGVLATLDRGVDYFVIQIHDPNANPKFAQGWYDTKALAKFVQDALAEETYPDVRVKNPGDWFVRGLIVPLSDIEQFKVPAPTFPK